MCFAAVSENLVAERPHLSAILYGSGIEAAVTDLARALCDFIRDSVLVWWDILRVERIVRTDISMLVPHFVLIAILSISFLEVLDRLRVNADSLSASPCLHLLLIKFEVDLRAQRSEILVEALLATQWSVWIKDVEWLAVDLISRCNHLIRHQYLLIGHFRFGHIWEHCVAHLRQA